MTATNFQGGISKLLAAVWHKTPRRRKQSVALAESLEPRALLAAVVELVQDYNTAPASSVDPSENDPDVNQVVSHGIYYFSANDQMHGPELWRSDGTSNGTIRLTDTARGISQLTVVGDAVYFLANEGALTRTIWTTDGTVQGTRRLLDGSGEPMAGDLLTAWNGELAYVFSRTLYATNGTSSGTRSLATLPGTDRLDQIVVNREGTLFIADNILSSTGNNHRSEIWMSRGNQVSTELIVPYAGDGQIRMLTVGKNLYWTDPINGSSMGDTRPRLKTLTTNSTEATRLGTSGGHVATGSHLFFVSGMHSFWPVSSLFVTTESDPRTVELTPTGNHSITSLSQAGNVAYFLDGGSIWRSDGTLDGTDLLLAFEDYSQKSSHWPFKSLSTVGDNLLLSTDQNDSLWIYQTTTNELFPVTGVTTWLQNTITQADTQTDPSILFVGTSVQHGAEYWISDGTPGGTKQIKDIATGTAGSQLLPTGTTNDGTLTVGPSRSIEYPRWGIRFRDMELSLEELADSTTGIFATRAGSTEPQLILNPGTWVYRITALSESFIFETFEQDAGNGIWMSHFWVSDGTRIGTYRLKNIPQRTGYNITDHWSVVNDRALFTILNETTGQRDIWITDGTDDGTFQIRHNLESSLMVSDGGRFISYRDGIAFTAATAEYGREIFRFSTNLPIQPPLNLKAERTAGDMLITWNDTSGATEYDVWVQNIADSTVIRRRVHTTQLEIRSDISGASLPDLDRSAFRIWVRSVSLGGSTSSWSGSIESEPLDAVVMRPIPRITNEPRPTFDWIGPESASQSDLTYELWLTHRDTRTRTLYRTGLQSNSFSVPQDLAPGKYAVWVRAVRKNSTSTAWSNLTEFELLAPPIQLVSGSSHVKTARPEFGWSAVPNATGYDVRIVSADTGRLIYSARNVAGIKHVPQTDLPAGRFRVFVRALRGSQPYSAWGQGDSLWLMLPPAPVRASQSMVTWNAVPFAASYSLVLLNSRGSSVVPLTTQAATSFNIPQDLAPGQYSFRAFANFAIMSSDWSKTLPVEIFHAPVSLMPHVSETVDATPIIRWHSKEGAATYEVKVTSPQSSTPIYLRNQIQGTSHRIDQAISNGLHLIHVRAIFADGSRSEWSIPQSILFGASPRLQVSSNVVSWNTVNDATHYELWVNRLAPTAEARILYAPVFVDTSVMLPKALPKGKYQVWLRAVRSEAGATYAGRWVEAVFEIV